LLFPDKPLAVFVLYAPTAICAGFLIIHHPPQVVPFVYSQRQQRTLERRDHNCRMLRPYECVSPLARALIGRWNVRRTWLVQALFDDKVR
jgi:hypothetical protein